MTPTFTPLHSITDHVTLLHGMYVSGEKQIAVKVEYSNGEASYLSMPSSYAKRFAEALLKRCEEAATEGSN